MELYLPISYPSLMGKIIIHLDGQKGFVVDMTLNHLIIGNMHLSIRHEPPLLSHWCRGEPDTCSLSPLCLISFPLCHFKCSHMGSWLSMASPCVVEVSVVACVSRWGYVYGVWVWICGQSCRQLRSLAMHLCVHSWALRWSDYIVLQCSPRWFMVKCFPDFLEVSNVVNSCRGIPSIFFHSLVVLVCTEI